MTASGTDSTMADGEGTASSGSEAAQQPSASAWLTACPAAREPDVCIGHAPSEQQAIRASGVGIQPAHRAALPAASASTTITAEKRRLKFSTVL
jgi:hypothetical protein